MRVQEHICVDDAEHVMKDATDAIDDCKHKLRT
jgi:hypothetical protein